jgi:hypothetical protein
MHIFQVTAPYSDNNLHSLKSVVCSALDSRLNSVYNVDFVVGPNIECKYIGGGGYRKLRSDVAARAELAGRVAAKCLYREIAKTMISACNDQS